MSTQPLLQRTAAKRIALPVRVEPKVAFANERTFLSWLHFTVVLGGLAVGLLNFGDKVGKISAAMFSIVGTSSPPQARSLAASSSISSSSHPSDGDHDIRIVHLPLARPVDTHRRARSVRRPRRTHHLVRRAPRRRHRQLHPALHPTLSCTAAPHAHPIHYDKKLITSDQRKIYGRKDNHYVSHSSLYIHVLYTNYTVVAQT